MNPAAPRAGRLLALLLLHAAVFWGLVFLDPGAMHNHEILEPAAVAHEYNRGTIPLSEFRTHLNAEITIWETLELAGWFRVFGPFYPVTLAMAYIPALLILLLWQRVLSELAGPRTALRAVFLLAIAPPSYLLLTTQIDSRHIAFNVCLPLLLFFFCRGVLRERPAMTLLFAGLAVFSVTLARPALVVLAALGIVWLATGARSARWLIAGGAAALACQYLFPPAGFGALVKFHQWTVLDLLRDNWSPTRSLQLLTATFADHWPASFSLPAGGGPAYLFLLAAAAIRLLLRPPSGDRGRLAAILGLFLFIYLAALAFLRLDSFFAATFAPAWWRYRYLVSLTPTVAVLLALAAGGLPRRGKQLLAAMLTLLFLAGLPAAARFRGQPLDSYSPFNYRILGEQLADHFTPSATAHWTARLARFAPPFRESLVSGLATSAVNKDRPAGHFAVVLAHITAADYPVFYRAAGYWSMYNSTAGGRRELLDGIADPRWRATFSAGQNLADAGREWWPEYHALPGRPGLVE